MNEIVAPSISFNPKFNPFDDTGKGKSGSGTGSSGENPSIRNPMNSNWETLYEISEKAEVSQLDLHNEESTNTKVSSEKQIFQLHNCLIISQIKSGFIVVEQQSAHERVLYERFIQQLDNHKGASQQSLFPQTVTLNAADFELIQDLLPQIEILGFQVRPFGRTSLVIEGIPADIGPGLSETQVIEQLLETYKNYQSVDRLSKRESLARSLARNAAIKSGTSLSKEAMGDLIDQLFACESPNVSLSGKPIIITFTLKELLEKFGKLN